MRFSLTKFGLILLLGLLLGCKEQDDGKTTLKVGTISGPETRLMQVAKHVAKEKFGLNIAVIEFNDYLMPNTALADNSINANMFQHEPYLKAASAAKGYDFAIVGKTFVYPMGLYSSKHQHLEDLPSNAKIAIPNDPSNEARALLLLEKAGLIKLNSAAKTNVTTQDIEQNPKKLIIQELDAAQLPRTLSDVDLAAINTNYAMVAGFIPSRDALFIEDKHSPYANIVVVRNKDKNDARFKQLVEALHSQDVIATADQLFHGEAIPAWETN